MDALAEGSSRLLEACEGGGIKGLALASQIVDAAVCAAATASAARPYKYIDMSPHGRSYPDVPMFGNITPLHVAARCGHLEIVTFLLGVGADKDRLSVGWAPEHGTLQTQVDPENLAFESPLYIASQHGRVAVVEVLLAAGAATDRNGIPPLQSASWADHLDIAGLLVDAGADVNTIDEDRTALYVAAEEGHVGLTEFLIANGADVNFSRLGPINPGATSLFAAAYQGHLEVAKLLVGAGADVNASRTDDRSSPLYIACNQGHLEVVAFLLANGAAADIATSDNGATALYAAAFHGHLAVAEALIAAGADVDRVSTGNGGTPLYAAAEEGHVALVKALIGLRLPFFSFHPPSA